MSLEALEPWGATPERGSAERLADIGLTTELLVDAVVRGVRQAQNISTFHPVTARGFTQWSETVASLREATANLGWVRCDPQNSPRVMSPDGRTSLMVAGGDAATGISLDTKPLLARRRGPSTRAAIQVNGQQVFDIRLQLESQEHLPLSWMLLYHWAADRPVVRSELSLPIRSTDAGQVEHWSRRILLLEQDLSEFSIAENPAGPQDDVDFEIVELK